MSPRSGLKGWAIYIAVGWISLSCVGYGLALNKYAAEEEKSYVKDSFGGFWEPHNGKITEVNGGVFGDPEIKMENVSVPIILPIEFIDDPNPKEAFKRYIQVGNQIEVAVRRRDRMAVELHLNTATANGFRFVPHEKALKILHERIEKSESMGLVFILAGVFLLPALILIKKRLQAARR